MSVVVEVLGKNLNINDRLQDYVTKRMEKLDRFLNGIEEARVDLAYVKSARNMTDRQVAQITVRGKNFILRSEERGDDIQTAFDQALEKLQRQIGRYKGKKRRGRGDGTSAAEMVAESPDAGEEIEEEEPLIARRKKFLVTPMDESEAIEQMKLLGHDLFFVFFNVGTGKINILYRRRDKSYGLIEPEII